MNYTAKFGYGHMAGEKPAEEEYAAVDVFAMQDMENLFYYWRSDYPSRVLEERPNCQGSWDSVILAGSIATGYRVLP